MTTVTVGCMLPNGVVIGEPGKSVRLNGPRSSQIIGAPYGLTEVDADFWADWSMNNMEFPPFKNGFIFAASNANAAKDMGEERRGERTGLEQADPKAHGVTKADAK